MNKTMYKIRCLFDGEIKNASIQMEFKAGIPMPMVTILSCSASSTVLNPVCTDVCYKRLMDYITNHPWHNPETVIEL